MLERVVSTFRPLTVRGKGFALADATHRQIFAIGWPLRGPAPGPDGRMLIEAYEAPSVLATLAADDRQ